MKLLSLMLVVSMGCASVPKTEPAYLIDADRWVEKRDLPETPYEALDKRAFAVEVGEPAEFSAVCLSEDLANEYAEYKIRYSRLRLDYEGDRLVWIAHRDAYETKLKLDEQRIEDMQTGWWEDNDAELTGAVGFMLGVLATIATTYALKGATK